MLVYITKVRIYYDIERYKIFDFIKNSIRSLSDMEINGNNTRKKLKRKVSIPDMITYNFNLENLV